MKTLKDWRQSLVIGSFVMISASQVFGGAIAVVPLPPKEQCEKYLKTFEEQGCVKAVREWAGRNGTLVDLDNFFRARTGDGISTCWFLSEYLLQDYHRPTCLSLGISKAEASQMRDLVDRLKQNDKSIDNQPKVGPDSQ